MKTPLVGIGYDIHSFAENRLLILGGITIPFKFGLSGHSDADVLSHAIADAILGAIGEKDIGYHFPNTDPSIEGISSLKILEKTLQLLKAQNAQLVNIDASLIAEAPKITPHLDAIRLKLSGVLGIPTQRIGIKATTNEKLGSIGRGEGIAAMAVACVLV